MPEVDHLNELITFFEHTYVRGRRQRGRDEMCAKTENYVSTSVTGLEYPTKKRYRCLQSRVQRCIAAYGRAEILVYIRAIAHLSHT